MTAGAIVLLSTLPVSGFLGGLVGYYLNRRAASELLVDGVIVEEFGFWACIFMGISAAIATPFLLSALQSTLVRVICDPASAAADVATNLFVVNGLAAITAIAFIQWPRRKR